MKKITFILILSLFTIFAPIKAQAGKLNVPQISYGNISGGQAMKKLSDNIYNMAKKINKSSSQLMKFGNMLYCSSIHGKAAEWHILEWKWKVISFELLLSSAILMLLGFIISMIASFYMFDVAFNLSISIVLLPLGIALWPFGWTKKKLKVIIDNITYYVGVFIFLPLGILIANAIAEEVIASAFGNSSDLILAFENDQSDLIEDMLSFWNMLGIILSYVVAIRIIPLFANEFCNHFFSGQFAGGPISARLTQMITGLKKNTVDRVGKYGKDVVKHQIKRKLNGR
ncbi:MAG: hypothetical protein IKW39_06015 [Alphaproteobacteria bacterium]|nr:hypothetical protein [Alphaproteobacteria bacterium]